MFSKKVYNQSKALFLFFLKNIEFLQFFSPIVVATSEAHFIDSEALVTFLREYYVSCYLSHEAEAAEAAVVVDGAAAAHNDDSNAPGCTRALPAYNPELDASLQAMIKEVRARSVPLKADKAEGSGGASGLRLIDIEEALEDSAISMK